VPGASPISSPQADFSTQGSLHFGTPRSVYSMEPVARNGLSLARNGCFLSEASIPGSMVPACHFATLPACSPPGPPTAPLPSTGLPQSMAES